jgi:hypothetical protein
MDTLRGTMTQKMANYMLWSLYDFVVKAAIDTDTLLVAQTGDLNTDFQLVGINIV